MIIPAWNDPTHLLLLNIDGQFKVNSSNTPAIECSGS